MKEKATLRLEPTCRGRGYVLVLELSGPHSPIPGKLSLA